MDLGSEPTDEQSAFLFSALIVGVGGGMFLGWLAEKVPVNYPPLLVEIVMAICLAFTLHGFLNLLRLGSKQEPFKLNRHATLCFAVLIAALFAGVDYFIGYFEGSYGILGVYMGALIAQMAAFNFGALLHLTPRKLDWEDVIAVLLLSGVGWLIVFTLRHGVGWSDKDLAMAMMIPLGLMFFGGIPLSVAVINRLKR
jgi:hypothetical protein